MLKRDGMPRHREVPSPSPLSVLDRTAGKEQRHRRLVPLFLVGALLVGTEATAEVVLDPGESAWAAVQRGQLERAREEAAAVLADDSKDARAAVVYAETVTMPAIDEGGETAQLPLPELLEGLHATAATRGHALVARAVLWRRAERPDLAETDLLAAREVAERQGDEELAMIVAEQLAVTLVSLARPPEAIAAAEEALVAAEARERPVAAVLAHLTLGRALVRTRQVELAEEHLQAARDGARRLDLPRWEGTAEIALSVLSRFRMDLDEAMVRREAALDAYRRGHDLSGQARALHYIATIRIFRGELSAAMGQLLEALELARSAENDVETSGCLGDLAGINYLLGDLEQARIQYEEAVRLTDHPLRRGLWQINLGSILTHQDRHEEALASYREALESLRAIGDRRNESVALLSIGRSLVELGRTEEGLAQLQEAVAVARRWEQPENEAQVLRFLGLAVAARGDLTAAADTLAHATELARRTGNYQILEASLVTEAGLARRRGQFDEAQHIIDEALLVVGDVRRRSGGAAAVQSGVFAEAYEVYGLAIDLLYQQHRKEPSAGHDLRAFELAQEAKARSFLDLLAEAEVDLRCRADARYVTREAEILDEIADLDGRGLASPDSASILAARIAGLEDELDLLEADIRAADPRYAAVRYPRPCDLPTARRLLADDEALVEFALGDSASYVWAITDTDLVFAALPPRREIETEVRELLPLLQDPNLTGDDPAWYHPAAGALFDRLLGPVRSVIAGRERLVIAPDGLLHYLPIEALLVRRPSSEEASSYASLPYLRDAYVVSYVPSVSVLHHLRDGDAIAAANRYLLVGDPVTGPRDATSILVSAAGGADLPPLAHAAVELEAIEEIAGPETVVRLDGPRARAGELREAAGHAPFVSVHFVVHGLFNETRPQFSGLLLSPDPDAADDGFLSTGEVFGLDLPCRQVVLSACSTALGREVDGEGLVGLTRGFFFAGARRVISSLWDVSDRSTALLMSELYRQQSRGVDAATALTRAKQFLGGGIRTGSEPGTVSYSHPFYWAGFVLHGVGRENR